MSLERLLELGAQHEVRVWVRVYIPVIVLDLLFLITGIELNIHFLPLFVILLLNLSESGLPIIEPFFLSDQQVY